MDLSSCRYGQATPVKDPQSNTVAVVVVTLVGAVLILFVVMLARRYGVLRRRQASYSYAKLNNSEYGSTEPDTILHGTSLFDDEEVVDEQSLSASKPSVHRSKLPVNRGHASSAPGGPGNGETMGDARLVSYGEESDVEMIQ